MASDEDMSSNGGNGPLTTLESSISNPQPLKDKEAAPEVLVDQALLPANHVIQYSPQRTASEAKKASWTGQPQTYQDSDSEPMDLGSFSVPLVPQPQEILSKVEVQLEPKDMKEIIKTPSPKPRTRLKGDEDKILDENKSMEFEVVLPVEKKVATFEMDKTKEIDILASIEPPPSLKSPRTPIPTPRKSVTLMEVGGQEPQERCKSVMETSASEPLNTKKKISFNISKKLSTFSLHTDNATEAVAEVIEENLPLQRRNSIHNVPYVDVNDPQTRERMERYKEERRSMLRAKYKVEDYMNTSNTDNTAKYQSRRKSTENKPTEVILRPQIQKETTSPMREDLDSTEVILRPQIQASNSPVREEGLIDEDVNVKERAALFGGSCNNQVPKNNNRSVKSWSSSTPVSCSVNAKAKEAKVRPLSESNGHNNQRKISPGSPSKIRDMAAFFEQKN